MVTECEYDWPADLRIKNEPQFECEFGGKVRFLNPKFYDADDIEIVIPTCEKCNGKKSMIIGKSSFAYVCGNCVDKSKLLFEV